MRIRCIVIAVRNAVATRALAGGNFSSSVRNWFPIVSNIWVMVIFITRHPHTRLDNQFNYVLWHVDVRLTFSWQASLVLEISCLTEFIKLYANIKITNFIGSVSFFSSHSEVTCTKTFSFLQVLGPHYKVFWHTVFPVFCS